MKRWPQNKAYFWETAPFFRILLPFAAGILSYDLAQPTAVPSLVFALVPLILFVFTGIALRGRSAYGLLSFVPLASFLYFAGASLAAFSDARNSDSWFGHTANTNTASYMARVCAAPLEKENAWKLPVSIFSVISDGKVSAATGDALLYIYKDDLPMLLNYGDSIIIPGNWQSITNAGNPFEFDYATWCRRNNTHLHQSLSMSAVRLYATNDPAHTPLVQQAHDWCMDRLDTYLPDAKTKGLIQAMLLGDEQNLDEGLLQSYAETGIIHIIAISGGNVGILFLFISFLLWWLKDRRHLWLKYAVALPMVWFYVVMAGAPPSAIRAALMFTLLAFGIMLQKSNNSLNQLFATAFLLLCAQPMWLFATGFQLSFVAVLSLILFYSPVYNWLSPSNRVLKLLWGTVAASIAAEALVAPLVIYYFHTFPLLFLVANVLAYLFMTVALFLGIAVIACSFIPAVSSVTGMCAAWLVTVFDSIVVWLQRLNPASFRFLVLTGTELLMVYLTIGGVAVFLLRKNKPALFTGLGAACMLMLLFCADAWTGLRQERLVVYNTGKTTRAELISGNTYRVLYTDTAGGKKTDYATKPAHTCWRAWHRKEGRASETWSIAGKTVLILNCDVASGRFPVDYLVLHTAHAPDAARLKEIFTPRLVVIGNSMGRKQREQFVRDCKKNFIEVFELSREGAFVIK